MQVGLINPNTNVQTTQMMVSIARSVETDFTVTGFTVKSGPQMIQNATDLDASAGEVVRLAANLGHLDGVIVSAFGDPGAAELTAKLSVPVIGIGAAAARLALTQGGMFAVVTTTIKLAERIDQLMQGQGANVPYVGTFVTPGDTDDLMSDPKALDAALLVQIKRVAQAGARRAIIGGGPLGMAAVRLAAKSPIPLINPIHAAAREMSALLSFRKDEHGS